MMTVNIKQRLLTFVSVVSFLILPGIVNAASYTTTDNLFENSYTNNLIDMAQTQVDNISNKKYVIFQTNSYDYYMVTADKKNVTVNNNTITMNNAKIIRVLRTQNGYNYVYNYSTIEENSTTIYVNNIVVSNVDTSRSVSSQRYENYRQNNYNTWLLVFILGLVFAIFLTKERSY